MKRFVILVLVVLSLPLAVWAQAVPMAASNGAVTDLGSLGSGNAIAYGVSANGGVVTGISTATGGIGGGNDRGFRWTAAGGIQDLDSSPNDGVMVRVHGISADGNTIVGEYGHYPECNPNCAFTWSGGLFDILGGLPGGWYSPTPTGASKDGGVIVGWAHQTYGGPDHAWRYTGLSGFVDLGALPNSCCGSQALAVSEDGAVVVGYSYDVNMHQHAFRWTQKSGMQDLGFLSAGSFSNATGASTNGSVVVGYADTNVNCPPGLSRCNVPFRWTKATGMVALPILSGKGWAVTTGVSADGKTVVGYDSQNCCNWVAWRWTQATGKQTINDWLADVGVDATAFNFYSAYAVTANGEGVVGQLTNGDAYLALATSNKTGMPTFSPKPGTYHGSVSVTLNHTSPQASIFYTTDGSTPTKNSTPYTAPILVTVTTTIKSIAIVPSYPQSAVATGKYTIK
jgi:probable HAF family extracellular repeat protein